MRFLKLYPFLILVVGLLLFYPTIVTFQDTFIHSGMIISDLYSFNYPVKNIFHNELVQGRLPFWTNLVGNGYPLFAEGQMGMLYPIHLLLFAFPLSTTVSIKLLILGHLLLASTSTFILLKKMLKTNTLPALLSSITFMFSGFMTSFIEHTNVLKTVSYFPLDLVFVEYLLNKEKITLKTSLKVICLATILFSFQLLAGHIETVFYNILFSACYAGLRLLIESRTRKDILKKFIAMLVAGIIVILIISPQYLATFELIKYSQRDEGISIEAATAITWPLETLQLFINPRAYPYYSDSIWYKFPSGALTNIQDIYPYLGILPLILALISIITLFSKRRTNTFVAHTLTFLLLILITFLYAAGSSTQMFAVIRNSIPGLSFFRFPFKAIYIIEFSLCVLAGVGMELLMTNKFWEDKSKVKLSLSILILSIVYINLWIYNRPLQPTANTKYWLETPVTATYLLSEPDRANWRIFSRSIDLAGNENILNTGMQKDLQNMLPANFNSIYDIPSNAMYAGLYLKSYTDLNDFNIGMDTSRMQNSLDTKGKRLLGMQSVKYVITHLPINDPDFTEVKTFKFENKIPFKIRMTNEETERIEKSEKVYIYTNKDFVPRFQFIPKANVRFVKNDNEAYKSILEGSFDPQKSAIITSGIEDTNPIQSNLIESTSRYILQENSSTKIIVETHQEEEEYFVIHDLNYPGWHALIDGKETAILNTDYAFKSILVAKGDHHIEFYFEPTYWKLGLMLTAIGSIILLIMIGIILLPDKEKIADNSINQKM